MTDGMRNDAVDAVRAAALFGICVVNVQFHALPLVEAFSWPAAAIDQLATLAVEMLFQGKFFLLFSFMFGWGIHVQEGAAARAGVPFNGRYGRRLLGLAVLGCGHAVLVFTGDILLLYALLGALIWPLRRASPRMLCRLAVSMLSLAVLGIAAAALVLFSPSESAEIPPLATAGFIAATAARLADWPGTFGFLLLFQGPLAFAAFAIGLAAAKVGALDCGSPIRRCLERSAPVLFLLGAPFNLAYALSAANAPGLGYSPLLGFTAIVLGAPLAAAAYLGLLLRWGGGLPSWMRLAGRNSLSVYVFQGVLAGLVFGAPGLGLFGSLGAAALLALALPLAACALLAVAVAARRWERGPLEHLLRRWSYGVVSSGQGGVA